MPRLACATALLAMLLIAACGGSDAPSASEFANDADRICNNAEETLESLGEGAETPEEVVAVIQKGLKRTRSAADQLVELERPEGADGETATKFVEGFSEELDSKLVPALEELKAAVKDRDEEAVQAAAQKLSRLEASESDRYARELGARACVG